MEQIEGKKELTENDLKKEYLWKYKDHVRSVHRLTSEIAELREMKEGISGVNNDGLPHGSGQMDLSGYAAELTRMEEELQNERYLRIKSYQEIARLIKRLRSESEKDVLFYRYIKGMDWWEIAEKMQYSERHITRIHGKALAHFRMPEENKDVLECPTSP